MPMVLAGWRQTVVGGANDSAATRVPSPARGGRSDGSPGAANQRAHSGNHERGQDHIVERRVGNRRHDGGPRDPRITEQQAQSGIAQQRCGDDPGHHEKWPERTETMIAGTR